MLTEQRTQEEYDSPIEVGEPALDHEPQRKSPEAETVEETKDLNPEVDSTESLKRVTDEEIESGAFRDKLQAHSALERGGKDGEVKVDMKHDSRYLDYFNAEGVRINAETGNPALDDLIKYYRHEANKSEEEIAKIVESYNKIDKDLLENPNTFIRINDYTVEVDGVKILKVGYAFVDSKGRISYFDVEHIPEDESPEEDEDGMDNLNIEDSDSIGVEDIVFVEESEDDMSSDAEILAPFAAAESIEIGTEEEANTTAEVSKKVLVDFHEVVESQDSMPQASDSIIDRLAREFGFTYGTEEIKETILGKEISEVESKAVEIPEVIAQSREQEIRPAITNEEMSLEVREVVAVSVVESVFVKEETAAQPQPSMVVETNESPISLNLEANKAGSPADIVTSEIAPIRLVLHTEKESIAPIPVLHQMREIISERVVVAATKIKAVEKETKSEIIPVAKEKSSELDDGKSVTQVVHETQVLPISIEAQSDAMNKEDKENIVQDSELTHEFVVAEKVISAQSEVQTRVQNSENFAQKEDLEMAEIVTQEFRKIQVEGARSFTQEQEIRFVKREVAIRNSEEFSPKSVERLVLGDEIGRVSDQLSSRKSGAFFTDDTQPANDNPRTEIIANTNNGITMRRIAA